MHTTPISFLSLSLFPLTDDSSSFEAGIKVQIHSQDEPPFIDQLASESHQDSRRSFLAKSSEWVSC